MIVGLVRLTADVNISLEPMSMRGRRRDKKTRSAAAEALLSMDDPPKGIRFFVLMTAVMIGAARTVARE